MLIADTSNHRIRRVDADFVPPPNVPGPDDDDPAPGPGRDPEPERQGDGPSETSSEPVLGETVVVAPAFGMVKVKLPGR